MIEIEGDRLVQRTKQFFHVDLACNIVSMYLIKRREFGGED
jgi:hypothetical protein